VALRQAGFDVRVYEQAPELTEEGGGINLGPNAARILYRLGLGAALDREAVRPISTHQRRWRDGRTLQRYERLRRPRVTRLPEMSRANQIRFHLPDGPAQEARDAEWARAGDCSPEALRWLYDFDADALGVEGGDPGPPTQRL
jgi:2-polyprenyl-6-methoxyphenol hydroxylase-like FAD-dependent oxidoreductase